MDYRTVYYIYEYGIIHGKRIIIDKHKTYSAREHKARVFELGRECRDIECYTIIEEIM